MKSYATFRRHPYGQVVSPTHEDRQTWEVVPYGKLGAGIWTGHPIGVVICIGLIVIGLVGIPEWRWFFGASVLAGSLVAYSLWRLHNQK
jgi:hypothetical protein